MTNIESLVKFLLTLEPLRSILNQFLILIPTQTNFLKHYVYVNFFASLQKNRLVFILFCFASSCTEDKVLCFDL